MLEAMACICLTRKMDEVVMTTLMFQGSSKESWTSPAMRKHNGSGASEQITLTILTVEFWVVAIFIALLRANYCSVNV